MKKRLLVLMMVAGGMVLALASTARSGDDEKKAADPAKGMSAEASQKAMEAAMKAMMPGTQHERLKHFVGDWKLTMKVWPQPGAQPMETPGSSTIKSVLGGRFNMEEFKSSMMGMPYEGIGMMGFNNTTGQYEGTWTSTMDTHIYTMKGTLQPDKGGKMNVFNFYGEMDEPAIGLMGRLVNYRTTIIDNDHHKFEIFDLAAGPDYKVIEIMYTRK